jgi:hypothetical protein
MTGMCACYGGCAIALQRLLLLLQQQQRMGGCLSSNKNAQSVTNAILACRKWFMVRLPTGA